MLGLCFIVLLYTIMLAEIDGHSSDDSAVVCPLADRVISPCFRWCEEKTCQSVLEQYPQALLDICNANKTCEYNVCVCRDGLYRNECNRCVKKEECYTSCKRYEPLLCTGENEELNGCFDPTKAKVCPRVRCSKPRDLFLQAAERNPSGLCVLTICDCKDGYLRNKCGKCVKPEECSKKCCIRKSDPCRGPNEVRVTKYRNKKCSNQGGKRRSKKSVCVCKEGYVRDQCGQCLKPEELNVKAPSCLVTNPCVQNPFNDVTWYCYNECNTRHCQNYYALQNKTCPTECVYACYCDPNKDLWFNGTHCVPGYQCPVQTSAVLEVIIESETMTDEALVTPCIVHDVYEFLGYLSYISSII